MSHVICVNGVLARRCTLLHEEHIYKLMHALDAMWEDLINNSISNLLDKGVSKMMGKLNKCNKQSV